MLFTLTILDSAGRETFRKSGVLSADVYKLARKNRPPLGSTAITRDDIRVPHKAVKPTDPFRGLHGHCSTSTRRPSNNHIESAARRFAADGEYENSAAMLELRK